MRINHLLQTLLYQSKCRTANLHGEQFKSPRGQQGFEGGTVSSPFCEPPNATGRRPGFGRFALRAAGSRIRDARLPDRQQLPLLRWWQPELLYHVHGAHLGLSSAMPAWSSLSAAPDVSAPQNPTGHAARHATSRRLRIHMPHTPPTGSRNDTIPSASQPRRWQPSATSLPALAIARVG